MTRPFLAITALHNLRVKQIRNFCKSHLTSVCAAQKSILNFFDSGRSEKKSERREKHTGWKNRNKTSESAGGQGHPECERGMTYGETTLWREWKKWKIWLKRYICGAENKHVQLILTLLVSLNFSLSSPALATFSCFFFHKSKKSNHFYMCQTFEPDL